MKIVKQFQLKIVIFTDVKNRCMWHGHVFVKICLMILLFLQGKMEAQHVVNMDQMAESVKMSSRNGHNIPQVYHS